MKERIRSRQRGRTWVCAVALAFRFAFSATAVHAVVNCDTTIVDPTSPLTDDYEHTTATGCCIQLTNGASLDLNGHEITQVGPGSLYAPQAICCAAPGSVISNSLDPNNPAEITGAWWVGISECEQVTDIHVAGLIGILNSNRDLDVASGNTIDAAGGIGGPLKDDDSLIANNVIIGVGLGVNGFGISVLGTTDGAGPLVEKNIIRVYENVGIRKTGTDKIRIRKNLLIDRVGTDCLDINPTGSTVQDNFCDCSDECDLAPPYNFPFK